MQSVPSLNFKTCVMRIEEAMSLLVFYYNVFAFSSVAVTVSTHLCVVCHHFCCPICCCFKVMLIVEI